MLKTNLKEKIPILPFYLAIRLQLTLYSFRHLQVRLINSGANNRRNLNNREFRSSEFNLIWPKKKTKCGGKVIFFYVIIYFGYV